MQNNLVAASIMLASSAAFGAMLGSIAKSGGFRMDEPERARPDRVHEWITVALTFGLVGLSLDAFGRWMTVYVDTGEMLSIEEITAEYE